MRVKSTSLERCIDPDSRGMTVSMALYTPGIVQDFSKNVIPPTENVLRLSGTQTGKVVTRLSALFYLSKSAFDWRRNVPIQDPERTLNNKKHTQEASGDDESLDENELELKRLCALMEAKEKDLRCTSQYMKYRVGKVTGSFL